MRWAAFITLLALASCARNDPAESFAVRACGYADTGVWRTRQERGHCIVRQPDRVVNRNHHPGGCIVWSTNTVHEKLQRVQCVKTRWVRR
jgi:hypothetical protein